MRPTTPLALWSTTLLALGLAATGSVATAGGFAEEVRPVSVAPRASMTVLPVSPVPIYREWIGGYEGLEFGQVEGRALDGPQKIDGSLFGVHAGYRFQTGRVVFGAELAYDLADLQISTSEVETVRRTGGQVGYVLGRALPFITAGQAVTRTDEEDEGSLFYGDLDGYFYGVGVDVAVTERLYAGAQYLAYEFDIESFDFEADGLSLRLGLRF